MSNIQRLWSSILFLCCTAGLARADLDLPRPSPFAKVVQTVGLTDITVDYSSPGVKGRKIWGAVVPTDQMWRAGANQATKITFSRDVTFAGKPVPAGTYAFFVMAIGSIVVALAFGSRLNATFILGLLMTGTLCVCSAVLGGYAALRWSERRR